MLVATVMKANEGESFDSLLKRFNRKVQQDGILSEYAEEVVTRNR